MVAIANIDDIIKIIKKSKDTKIAAAELCKKSWKAGPIEAILKKLAKMLVAQKVFHPNMVSKVKTINYRQIKQNLYLN